MFSGNCCEQIFLDKVHAALNEYKKERTLCGLFASQASKDLKEELTKAFQLPTQEQHSAVVTALSKSILKEGSTFSEKLSKCGVTSSEIREKVDALPKGNTNERTLAQ